MSEEKLKAQVSRISYKVLSINPYLIPNTEYQIPS
jgi:hypothetical protein